MVFAEAVQRCKDQDAGLVSIHSMEENAFVQRLCHLAHGLGRSLEIAW